MLPLRRLLQHASVCLRGRRWLGRGRWPIPASQPSLWVDGVCGGGWPCGGEGDRSPHLRRSRWRQRRWGAVERERPMLKLGLNLGYSGAHLKIPVELVQRAEALGYDSVWTAEAYGSDALTPLAYLAGKTSRIKLGTAIMQLAARTPANAAMSAATVDALAGGGRFIAGLGVSGPQIVEGWYGQPWGKPYWRIKDYVAIMRKVFKREAPVQHAGREIALPYAGPGATGVGKPLKSILRMNPDIPIYLGTGNKATVTLTAEIADGWLPLGFVPGTFGEYAPWLEEGFRRAGGGKSLKTFAIQGSVHVDVDSDVRAALD